VTEIEEEKDVNVNLPIPSLWVDLKDEVLAVSVGRRLLREIARVVAQFHGDAVDPVGFDGDLQPALLPQHADEVLSLMNCAIRINWMKLLLWSRHFHWWERISKEGLFSQSCYTVF